jgi:MFS transporter, PPP family, 3-phenylpropionic acid transporter
MPHQPKMDKAPDFARRLALFYAAFFVAIGINLPFFPVWLAARGLDAETIGLVLALPMVVRVFAIPAVSRVADRRDALRAAIVGCAFAAAVAYAAMGAVGGIAALVVAYAIASCAFAPVMSLADAYALKGLAARGRAYGPVRLWGSATFIAATFGAGVLLDVMAARDLIWLIVAAMAAIALASLMLAPLGGAAEPADAPRPLRLLAMPAFLAVAAASSLTQASHALIYGFGTLDWRAAGLSGTTIGTLWALGVVAEIVLFALQGRLPAWIGPGVLLLVGAAGGVVRWTAMALDPPAWMLPLLQCLHGLSFGATHLGSLGYLARAVPAGMAARAQGMLAVMQGLAMAAALALSGVLYADYGSRAYAAMALLAAAGLAAALAAQRAGRTTRRPDS